VCCGAGITGFIIMCFEALIEVQLLCAGRVIPSLVLSVLWGID